MRLLRACWRTGSTRLAPVRLAAPAGMAHGPPPNARLPAAWDPSADSHGLLAELEREPAAGEGDGAAAGNSAGRLSGGGGGRQRQHRALAVVFHWAQVWSVERLGWSVNLRVLAGARPLDCTERLTASVWVWATQNSLPAAPAVNVSLGGALATLAALDAAKAVEAGALGHPEGIMIQCYTFGAPRTG